jgi:hypothetical protein
MPASRSRIAALAVLLLLACGAYAADGPAKDAAKYPQDTAQKALGALIKAFDTGDVAYQIAWLVVPAHTEKLVKKYGTMDAAVKANSSPEKLAAYKEQAATFQKLLEANKTTQGEDAGVKWTRFEGGPRLLQLELQADGRWCLNPHAEK